MWVMGPTVSPLLPLPLPGTSSPRLGELPVAAEGIVGTK